MQLYVASPRIFPLNGKTYCRLFSKSNFKCFFVLGKFQQNAKRFDQNMTAYILSPNLKTPQSAMIQ